jgi:hypothetical protein
MPDASDPRGRGPTGWADAFAAMPQEAPPADAWPRIAARLDARAAAMAADMTVHRHGRRRFARNAGWLGAATAAALALVVAWPRHDAAPVSSPHPRASMAPVASVTPAATRAADTSLAVNKPKRDTTAIALPKVIEAARKPRFAGRGNPAHPTRPQPAMDATTAKPATDAAQPLDALYAESARLEALLALARDDRVASASAALLSAALDAQVAGIDARLAQPGLDDAQRTALWQARVDALRQAAGFESTQRVLASQGDGGALLVSVD